MRVFLLHYFTSLYFAAFHFDGRQNEYKKNSEKQNGKNKMKVLHRTSAIFSSQKLFSLLNWYAKQEFIFDEKKGTSIAIKIPYLKKEKRRARKNDAKKIISANAIDGKTKTEKKHNKIIH